MLSPEDISFLWGVLAGVGLTFVLTAAAYSLFDAAYAWREGSDDE